jgi:hypothetical protein
VSGHVTFLNLFSLVLIFAFSEKRKKRLGLPANNTMFSEQEIESRMTLDKRGVSREKTLCIPNLCAEFNASCQFQMYEVRWVWVIFPYFEPVIKTDID